MTTDEALTWLDSTRRFGVKLGLENTRALLGFSGNPERQLRFIHVAGTNGKGSVCAMISSILQKNGCRVGLFTSPHLVDFRERITVDGEWIPNCSLTRILTMIREMSDAEGLSPTFFEVSTVLALVHFAESACDWVVLETGLGGRLDSTNVVLPEVSVITRIGMDHMKELGGTIQAIAGEKAGIIKRGVPVVSAPQLPEALSVIKHRAADLGSKLHIAADSLPPDAKVGLPGLHQLENAAVAVAAVSISGAAPSPAAIRDGLAGVQWPGRFDQRGPWLLDAAHNPDGARQFVETWREKFGGARPAMIIGVLADKDWTNMLDTFAEIAGSFRFVPIDNVRSADPVELAEGCPAGIPHRKFKSLNDALDAGPPGSPALPTVITGSIYLLGEAISKIDPAKAKS